MRSNRDDDVSDASNWLSRIRATSKVRESDRLRSLRQIAEDIVKDSAILGGKLSSEAMSVISAEFSAAFKPLGTKPRWASNITLLFDSCIMQGYETALARGFTKLPPSEFSPRHAGAGA